VTPAVTTIKNSDTKPTPEGILVCTGSLFEGNRAGLFLAEREIEAIELAADSRWGISHRGLEPRTIGTDRQRQARGISQLAPFNDDFHRVMGHKPESNQWGRL